jgi:TonB family protein
MKRTGISLLILATAVAVMAQDPGQKPADTEKPKNAIERMLDEAKERGELIVPTCLDNCEDADKSPDGLETGRALRLPKPEYPVIARRAHATGEVAVRIIIDVDGQVIAASSISGHPLLQAAAVTAARDSLFAPSKFQGKPVKVVGAIHYNFY